MGVFGPVRVNQPVEIEINLLSGPKMFKSRVEGISENNLIVGAPIVNGQVITIKPGTEVRVSYLDNIALYTFNSVILAENIKPVPTLTLDKPYNVKRVQRRNFVRIDTKLPVSFAQLRETLERCSEEYTGTTIDISGGGTMLASEQPVPMNAMLELRFDLPDKIKVCAIGKVVRVFEKKQGAHKVFSVGVEFSIIEEGERDKIIRYIFNQQRELRRKGLL